MADEPIETDNCRASYSGDCLRASYGYPLCAIGQCVMGEYAAPPPAESDPPKRAERRPVRGWEAS